MNRAKSTDLVKECVKNHKFLAIYLSNLIAHILAWMDLSFQGHIF